MIVKCDESRREKAILVVALMLEWLRVFYDWVADASKTQVPDSQRKQGVKTLLGRIHGFGCP